MRRRLEGSRPIEGVVVYGGAEVQSPSEASPVPWNRLHETPEDRDSWNESEGTSLRARHMESGDKWMEGDSSLIYSLSDS